MSTRRNVVVWASVLARGTVLTATLVMAAASFAQGQQPNAADRPANAPAENTPANPAKDASANALTGADVALALERKLESAIAGAEPSIVAIARVRKLDNDQAGGRQLLDGTLPGAAPAPTDPNFVPNEYGTGVVIDRRGLILTAYHVLGNPDENEYYVWTNRVPYKAVKVQATMAGDPWMDLAVLKIDADDLQPIRFGDADQLRKGQFVIGLGNPLAIARDGQASATWGIVSNLSRKAPMMAQGAEAASGHTTLHHYGTLIQTDAKLNFGVSGGALINLQGEMVGLLVSLSAGPQYDSAAGFAIPVDEHFKRTVETLKAGRRADYGFLGVLPWSLTREERQQGLRGARIRDVVPGTPAAQSDLRAGDLILAVNGRSVFDDNDLIRHISAYPPETEVRIELLRNEQRRTERVVLGKKPLQTSTPPYYQQPDPTWRGMQVEYVTAMPSFYQQSRLVDPRGCVGVLSVERESPAWNAGLRPGDFIATVGRQRVTRPADFYAAVEKSAGDVALGVISAGRVITRVVAKP